jgi:hypothetical protein
MGGRRAGWDRGGLFRIGLAVIALRILDERFLQPAAGTSATDHLVSGLVPLALLALAAYVFPRLSGARQGGLAITAGILGLTTGIDAAYYTRATGLGSDDVSGLLAIGASLGLIGLGVFTLWHTRSHDGHRAWRYGRRLLLAAGAGLAFMLAIVPIGVGYVETHVARAVVPADHLGTAHEEVSFTTRDGLKLEGWYIPSRNGAAVISFPGRKGPQRQARMLARHGYGVLLFDRRGEGRSEGEPNGWGWGGDEDIKAAIAYLKTRADVDPSKIGGIGLSVGGELMLEAAAETKDLAAVVSEGAGARTRAEEVDTEGMPTLDRWFAHVSYRLRDATVAIATGHKPPRHLKKLVPRIAPRPLLLIAAPNSPNGEKLNRIYYQAAHEPKALWEIPESGHVNGIAARPKEYERRVVEFFDDALRPKGAAS